MLLARISRRYLVRHPWLLFLSVVGVAVGVAVVVAIDLANSSSSRAFTLSADAVAGRTTHWVRSTDGDVADSVYTMLRLEEPALASAPVIDRPARIDDCDRRAFQFLGIDPLVDAQLRPYTGPSAVDLATIVTRPTVALSVDAARTCGVGVGDSIHVSVGGVTTVLLIGSLVEPADEQSATALEGLVITDISTAQELFDMHGMLTRIDLAIPDNPDEIERVRRLLSSGVVLEDSESRTETLSQMTRAFDVNLRALSLLALVVGMFLIYNSMTFSVVQRTPLIGRLRALGMTRREIFLLVCGEAGVIGIAGTAAGILLGTLLAAVLLDLVTRTIGDLYFAVTVSRVDVSPLSVIKGAALGIGVTVAAALRPAWEATAVPVTVTLQRSVAESTAHRAAAGFAAGSIGIAACAAIVLYLTQRSISLSYVGLLLVILAFVAAAPALVLIGSRVLRRPMRRLFGVIGTMAANAVSVSLSRTGVAIAALMVAVSATIGVGVMVSSFRSTVAQWLQYSLQADVYIQAPSIVVRRGDTQIRAEAVAAIGAAVGINEMYRVARSEVQTAFGVADAVIIEPGPMTPSTFELRESEDDVWADLATTDAVIVSEPFSFRYGVAAGDTIRVSTADGEADFMVVGVYLDYGSDLGAVLFSREVYRRHFPEPGVNGIALYVQDGIVISDLIEDLRKKTGDLQELYIQSNRSLRERSLEVFDRTFAVTNVLRLLTVVVAFIGVLSALMALQLEKSREFAVLRATGMTPGQVWRYVTLQTGVMGVLAGLLAIPLGLSLAALLVFVINKRSFGWTLQFDPTAAPLVGALVLALAAALIAGLYPAWRMSKTKPSLALRSE